MRMPRDGARYKYRTARSDHHKNPQFLRNCIPKAQHYYLLCGQSVAYRNEHTMIEETARRLE